MPSTSVSNYLTDDQLESYIAGNDDSNIDQTISKIMTTRTNGIEGLPYQFMESVDRRVTGTGVGRKYGERIFSRLPLLFLTPCEPLFMDDFSRTDRQTTIANLIGNIGDLDTISSSGRYYTIDFNYVEYYKYLNTMLSCLSVYLEYNGDSLYNTKIRVGDEEEKKIGLIDWSKELNSDFKTFFTAQENVVFYLDGLTSISESFSNDTTESSLASQINGFSDTAREIRYLFGSKGNAAAELVNSGADMTSSITSQMSGALTNVFGGIIGSISNNGVNTLLNGGKIIFPEMWSNSSYDKSYSIDIKLRSPDHDNLSIFLNVLKPYCKILALCMPRQTIMDGSGDPNGYSSPFLVKAYCKGMFNIDMGIISSLSVTKGAECCWNDDGLPTQIDISIEIRDLYKHLAMSTIDTGHALKSAKNLVNNTAYMDFLANMAGLNIAQMEVGRRITMLYYLSQSYVSRSASSIFRRFDQGVTKIIGKMYRTL